LKVTVNQPGILSDVLKDFLVLPLKIVQVKRSFRSEAALPPPAIAYRHQGRTQGLGFGVKPPP